MNVEKMIKTSKQVITDCSLENGALVAANITKKYYPESAKSYFFVWPRDSSYTCIAADIAGIVDIQEKFFNWCLNRAEGFEETGLFFENYHPNGLMVSNRFQPDQTGTMLFAIYHHYRKNLEDAEKFYNLIEKAANGICNCWDNDHFKRVANDLWEERFAFPDLKDNFTYSLAACISGLKCANQMINNKKWVTTANQMKKQLEKHFVGKAFVRSYGKLIDNSIDASTLGLIYPFEIYDANDSKIVSTINQIENTIVINGGLHRYKFDVYDGWTYHNLKRNKGGGAWPLLNFWMSIYHSLRGEKDKAKRYYKWVLDKVGNYIPEQIFENDVQVSVSPLVWSHAMFIISSKFLGYV